MRNPPFIVPLAVFALAGVLLCGSSYSAVITVCSSDCDYRLIQDAVDHAAPGDTIQLGPETFYENVLALGLGPLTIRGMGPERTIVDGGENDAVFALFGSGTVTLADLTVQNGKIHNYDGGGIAAGEFDELRIENCVVRDNRACSGAGVYWGGGVWTYFVRKVTIVDTTVRDNTCGGYGGGISLQSADEVLITNSAFVDNDNYGIWLPWNARSTIENTTVSGGDGGVHASGGTLSLSHSTITDSPRHGVKAYQSEVSATHNIISSLDTGQGCSLRETTLFSLGNNLDRDGTCGLTDPTDIAHENPMLLPLDDNGGRTPTCALDPDSPAIDAGGDTCLPTDQRGVARPLDGDLDGVPRCDIGAFEYEPPTPTKLLSEVIDHVRSLGLHRGTERSLLARLDTAMRLLTDVVPGNDRASVNLLRAFIHHAEAQRGKKIPEEQADELITEAQRIIGLQMLP